MLPILLDTCALIFFGEKTLRAAAIAAIDDAYQVHRTTYVSQASAWELGMLTSLGRIKLTTDPLAWFRMHAGTAGFAVSRLPDNVLVASSFLPGRPPKDPLDRIIIAEARSLGAVVMTRDRAILAYAAEGHVAAIAC